ncbi:MAG TPA: hypothetical protein VNV42_06205 [Solirubrobacteraceae bacterium]|jgi:hypothetical protein|nr:hypothetical protein [Solirubrobacteraceae bacterium]
MLGHADRQRRGGDLDKRVERAIILQLLRDDHAPRWARTELAREISDFQPAQLDAALARLEREAVVHREGDIVRASRAVRRLDELELISI